MYISEENVSTCCRPASGHQLPLESTNGPAESGAPSQICVCLQLPQRAYQEAGVFSDCCLVDTLRSPWGAGSHGHKVLHEAADSVVGFA